MRDFWFAPLGKNKFGELAIRRFFGNMTLEDSSYSPYPLFFLHLQFPSHLLPHRFPSSTLLVFLVRERREKKRTIEEKNSGSAAAMCWKKLKKI